MPSILRLLAWLAALAIALPAAAAQPIGDEMAMGDPAAPVTVIEYASASCPHCARFNNEVFPAFKAKYVDTGKVRYVFREFLTPPAEVAAATFLLARCAGPDKYFSVIDAVFHAQQAMYQSGDVRGTLSKAAGDAGLSEAQFEACLNDQTAQKALEDRVQRFAQQDHIDSTPTFVIGDQRLVGEQSLESLGAAIEAAEGGKASH